MQDDKDFDYNGRSSKIENFELKINHKYDGEEIKNDIMSYSDNKRDHHYSKKDHESTIKIKKSLKNKKFFKSIWFAMIISICLMLGQFVVFGALDMLAITREDKLLTIEIPKGAKKLDVVNILYENGVITQPTFFKLYLFLTKGSQKFIPGKFEIKTNLDYEAIVSYLQSNANRLDSDVVDVTIPEGKNVLEIAKILEDNQICSLDEFTSACNSNEFEKNYSFFKDIKSDDVIYKLEGYLFPDTYTFYKNIEPRYVIKKFLNNFNNKISKKLITNESNEKVSVLTFAEKKSISLGDLINLASLIQAEASNDADMLEIASVLENRLNTLKNGGKSSFGDAINGCLSVDATIWYPYRNRDKVPKDILENYESPYDTYKFSGLPKGPICNPGMTAIEAVLNHKSTQYYFYCHNKEGKTFFAKTFAEHGVNLKKAGLS